MSRQTHIYSCVVAAGGPVETEPGHIEVLRVLSVRPSVRGIDRASFMRGAGAATLHLEGLPGSSGSTVRRAELVFVPGTSVPGHELHRDLRLMRLHYPMDELHAVLDVFSQRARHCCYLWKHADGMRGLAMIVASR